MLRHQTLAITADTYTSVVPEVARVSSGYPIRSDLTDLRICEVGEQPGNTPQRLVQSSRPVVDVDLPCWARHAMTAPQRVIGRI